MRILVTGAAGFIGSHTCEYLAYLGHEVVGLDNYNSYYSPRLKRHNAEILSKQHIPIETIDLATDNLKETTRFAEAIVHCAAQPGISTGVAFDYYLRDNIVATHRLLEATSTFSQLAVFVQISTSSVYGAIAVGNEDTIPKPISTYGVTKLAAEQLVLSYSRTDRFPTCVLRLFSVYGPRERPDKAFPRLLLSLIDDRPFSLFEGSHSHKRSYTYVEDCARAIGLVLANIPACVGEILNIGSDVSVTTAEAIQLAEDIVGKPVAIDRQSPRAGDLLETMADIHKARSLIGYSAPTSLRDGLTHEYHW